MILNDLTRAALSSVFGSTLAVTSAHFRHHLRSTIEYFTFPSSDASSFFVYETSFWQLPTFDVKLHAGHTIATTARAAITVAALAIGFEPISTVELSGLSKSDST